MDTSPVRSCYVHVRTTLQLTIAGRHTPETLSLGWHVNMIILKLFRNFELSTPLQFHELCTALGMPCVCTDSDYLLCNYKP